MKKELQELSHADEEKLVKELSSMKVELTPEANFESRFLADFHNRLAESEVTSKVKLPFFVRVKAAITSPYGRSWIMGACAAVVVGFLVGGLLMVPEEDNVSVVSMSIPSSDMRTKAMRSSYEPAPMATRAMMDDCEHVSASCCETENACFEACCESGDVAVSAVSAVADEADANDEAAADEGKTVDTEVQDGE